MATHAQKVLKAIEAVIEKRATQEELSYTIAGRSLQKTPLYDLLKIRKEYIKEVNDEELKEKLEKGQNTGKTVRLNYIRPW